MLKILYLHGWSENAGYMRKKSQMDKIIESLRDECTFVFASGFVLTPGSPPTLEDTKHIQETVDMLDKRPRAW
ncbi:hypothetical protein FRB95_001748 [Tulasnella sp. JGI-2019a]|nr:hypothetical protein FRB95_001748 [Tulasnella sp. JGI-2019a]